MRGLVTLIAVAGFLFFEATAWWAHDQQRRLASWTQVPARIVSPTRFEYQVGRDVHVVEAPRLPYPPGANVTAFVDPKQPSRAVLDPRRGRALVWMFALGGLAWLFVWALAARGVDLRRKLA